MDDDTLFDQDDHFKDLVKSAKRKSLKRTIFVSFLVTLGVLVILWGLAAGGSYIMYSKMDKQSTDIDELYAISGANTTSKGTNYDYFFLVGTTKTKILKMVDTIPIEWDEKKYMYTGFGTAKSFDNDGEYAINSVQHYKNDHRVLNFRPPSVPMVEDDSNFLAQLNDKTIVEVGLSFSNELTMEEIITEFPSNLSWVWILDKHNVEMIELQKEENLPSIGYVDSTSYLTGEEVYGFEVEQEDMLLDAEMFINQVEEMAKEKDSWEIKELYDSMNAYTPKELKGAGVVLTGTVEQLKSYVKKDIVKHVSVGVIINN